MTILSEFDAAIAFARIYSRLGCSDFLALLDSNTRCRSQHVFSDLVGVDEIDAYLEGKLATLRSSGPGVRPFA